MKSEQNGTEWIGTDWIGLDCVHTWNEEIEIFHWLLLPLIDIQVHLFRIEFRKRIFIFAFIVMAFIVNVIEIYVYVYIYIRQITNRIVYLFERMLYLFHVCSHIWVFWRDIFFFVFLSLRSFAFAVAFAFSWVCRIFVSLLSLNHHGTCRINAMVCIRPTIITFHIQWAALNEVIVWWRCFVFLRHICEQFDIIVHLKHGNEKSACFKRGDTRIHKVSNKKNKKIFSEGEEKKIEHNEHNSSNK